MKLRANQLNLKLVGHSPMIKDIQAVLGDTTTPRLTVKDYERSIKFYCDGLGIEPAAIWNNDGGRALMLNMGSATLEIFDETQAQVIDQLEVEQRISGQIRFALQVPLI